MLLICVFTKASEAREDGKEERHPFRSTPQWNIVVLIFRTVKEQGEHSLFGVDTRCNEDVLFLEILQIYSHLGGILHR